MSLKRGMVLSTGTKLPRIQTRNGLRDDDSRKSLSIVKKKPMISREDSSVLEIWWSHQQHCEETHFSQEHYEEYNTNHSVQ